MDALKMAGIYTAVILGAGFASGKEILTFFINYGYKGFYGIILSGIIFSITGFCTLKIAAIKNIYTANDFFKYMLGDFSFIMETIVSIFLFIMYTTMLSATGATLKQEFNCHYICGIIFMATVCYFSYLFGTNFIAKINFFIAPILFFGVILIGLLTVFKRECFCQNQIWIKQAILYSSFNIVTGICVIIPILETLRNKNEACMGAIIGGIFTAILGIIIGLAIFFNYNIATENEIPMLAITNKLSNKLHLASLIIFLLAVFTTAVGNFFSLCEILTQKKIPIFFITLIGIIFANIEFSQLVSKIYPLLGYVGLFEIILIIFHYFTCNLNHIKQNTKEMQNTSQNNK